MVLSDDDIRTLSKNVESQLRDFEAKERKVQEHEAKAAKAEADAAMAAAAAAQNNGRPQQGISDDQAIIVENAFIIMIITICI